MKVSLTLLLLTLAAAAQAVEWSQLQSRYETRPTLRSAGAVNGNRVVGGNTARRHQFPYMAGLTLNMAGFCGGSLISPTIVIMAAHCARGTTVFDAHLGAHDISLDEEPDRQTVRTLDVTMHPQWDYDNINNDIAFIRFSSAVSGVGIEPVRLPSRSQQGETFVGQMARMTGWGMVSDNNYNISPTLKYTDLMVITNSECTTFYGSLINTSKICTDTDGGINGPCGGDSGGPLVIYEEDGLPTQVGMVSFGGDGCESGEPAVFTRLTSYIDWLQSDAGVPVRP